MIIKFKNLKNGFFKLYVDNFEIKNALVWPTDYTYYPDGQRNYPTRWACILDTSDTSVENIAKMKMADNEIESKRLLVEAYVEQHFELKDRTIAYY